VWLGRDCYLCRLLNPTLSGWLSHIVIYTIAFEMNWLFGCTLLDPPESNVGIVVSAVVEKYASIEFYCVVCRRALLKFQVLRIGGLYPSALTIIRRVLSTLS
jgi:hypothetical protein